jgi:hypothetical protein
MHGTIMKIKARLVVQGFYQCVSEDFKKNTTIAKYNTLQEMMVLVSHNN